MGREVGKEQGVLAFQVLPPWPLATPWWRPVGWERADRREESVRVEERRPLHCLTLAVTALGGEYRLCGRVPIIVPCVRGLSVKQHMCPCKQYRRWSPSSGGTLTLLSNKLTHTLVGLCRSYIIQKERRDLVHTSLNLNSLHMLHASLKV